MSDDEARARSSQELARDDALLAALAEAIRAADEVPAHVYELGKAAFAWRTVDVELAELLFDSSRAEDALAGARAETAALTAMTFVAVGVTIEVELTAEALQGQVVPPQAGRVEVQTMDDAERAAAVEPDGWFRFGPTPAALFRLQLTLADGRRVCTPWITP